MMKKTLEHWEVIKRCRAEARADRLQSLVDSIRSIVGDEPGVFLDVTVARKLADLRDALAELCMSIRNPVGLRVEGPRRRRDSKRIAKALEAAEKLLKGGAI